MRPNVCIVVADAARARLYLSEEKRGQAGQPAIGLIERFDMSHPARRRRDSEIFAESRPGSRRGDPGAPGHAVDDRRGSHRDETDRKFAVEIAREAQNVAGDAGCREIVIAAPPRMLGFLRELEPGLENAGFAVSLLERQLTNLSPAQLEDHPAVRQALR